MGGVFYYIGEHGHTCKSGDSRLAASHHATRPRKNKSKRFGNTNARVASWETKNLRSDFRKNLDEFFGGKNLAPNELESNYVWYPRN
jgi:hypothetical protein